MLSGIQFSPREPEGGSMIVNLDICFAAPHLFCSDNIHLSCEDGSIFLADLHKGLLMCCTVGSWRGRGSSLG